MDLKISAIVNTLNRQRTIKACLDSLAVQEGLEEIIIVDDGSTPPLPKMRGVCKQYRISETVGVAKSRNIGASHACKASTHLFFTDDDIVLDPHCFSILASEREWSKSKLAATGGSVPNMNVDEFVNYTWRYLARPMAINRWGEIVDLSEYWVNECQWHVVDHIRGGNQLIRKDAFFDVGGFPECYGVGGFREETDFCLMLREKGYTLKFNPCARAYHYKKDYGGVREHEAKEKRYDTLWRKRWQPKHFLGEERKYPPVLVRKLGQRM